MKIPPYYRIARHLPRPLYERWEAWTMDHEDEWNPPEERMLALHPPAGPNPSIPAGRVEKVNDFKINWKLWDRHVRDGVLIGIGSVGMANELFQPSLRPLVIVFFTAILGTPFTLAVDRKRSGSKKAKDTIAVRPVTPVARSKSYPMFTPPGRGLDNGRVRAINGGLPLSRLVITDCPPAEWHPRSEVDETKIKRTLETETIVEFGTGRSFEVDVTPEDTLRERWETARQIREMRQQERGY